MSANESEPADHSDTPDPGFADPGLIGARFPGANPPGADGSGAPLPNGPPIASPRVVADADTLPGFIRQVRRRAGLSQRELADAATLSQSTIARLESGRLAPSLATLLKLLAAARLVLVVTDGAGTVIQPMQSWDDTRDGAQRAFPAHLDLILDPRAGDWWGDTYGLARPPETFHRSRPLRDAKRRRSQWETRVAQFRHDPPPPRA